MSDRVNTFHDAWTKKEMTDPRVVEAYTPAGIKAIQANLQVASPNIYLTGNQEFVDVLDKNLGQGYVGQLKADEVLKADRRGFRQDRQADRHRQAEAGLQDLRRDHADRHASRRDGSERRRRRRGAPRHAAISVRRIG